MIWINRGFFSPHYQLSGGGSLGHWLAPWCHQGLRSSSSFSFLFTPCWLWILCNCFLVSQWLVTLSNSRLHPRQNGVKAKALFTYLKYVSICLPGVSVAFKWNSEGQGGVSWGGNHWCTPSGCCKWDSDDPQLPFLQRLISWRSHFTQKCIRDSMFPCPCDGEDTSQWLMCRHKNLDSLL